LESRRKNRRKAAGDALRGAACATYVGSWRRRFRITQGMSGISQFKDPAAGTTRSFCARCGTPIAYERARSPHMVNIPRARCSRAAPAGNRAITSALKKCPSGHIWASRWYL